MSRNSLAGLAVLLAAAAGCGPAATPTGKPINGATSPGGDPSTWTHAELVAHLHSRGVDFQAKGTDFGTFFGPAMEFEFPGGETVYVQVRKTDQEARDEAGPKGTEAFAWKRFYFNGPPRRLAAIRDQLP
jgi:hypothetical protein